MDWRWESGPEKSLIKIGDETWVDPTTITAVWKPPGGMTHVKADGEIFTTTKSVGDVLTLWKGVKEKNNKDPLRQQIKDMDPNRFARAAKNAAILAMELAEKSGIEISDDIRYLAETPEGQIAEARRKANA